MEFRPFGTTGELVSAVSFGTAPVGGLFGDLDEAQAVRAIHHALDAGINLVDTSPYYGSAEERLGKALSPHRRDQIFLATKAGRYGFDDFDFSPSRIRASLENSLRLLKVDYVDILQLHDVEFVPLDPVLTDSYQELIRLKEDGLCRFIGMTGYPLKTMNRILSEADLDVILTYAKGTLLDGSLNDVIGPLADSRGAAIMNASAVSLGLLTAGGSNIDIDHPAPVSVRMAARRMVEFAIERGVDIAFIANQYAIQRVNASTTVVGSAKDRHIDAAVRAAEAPIDEQLLADLLALRPPATDRPWQMGLPENN